MLTRNPNSAFTVIQRLIKKYQHNGDRGSLGICYQQLGIVLHYQGAYLQALPYFFKADQIFRQRHDQLLLAKNYNYIGQTYSSAHLGKKPLVKFHEALKIFTAIHDKNGVADTYSLLAKEYSKTDEYPTGLRFLRQALAIYQQTQDSMGMATLVCNKISFIKPGVIFPVLQLP